MNRSKLDTGNLIREIDRGIRRHLSRKKPASLYEPPQYLFAGGGKRLRAMIVLLACAMVGSDFRKALDPAVAVEILHNFSLIHDDIMDHDDLRRGRPTIHKKWDENVAILSGDLLAAVAFKALSHGPAARLPQMTRVFSEGFIQLCEGQALDKEFEARPSVSEREYLHMIALKTAALFRVSAQLGAMAGGAPPKLEKALSDFGHHLGMAFQIQDDWLDISANEEMLGKTIGSDLIEHKKTYPTILASRDPAGVAWLERFHPENDPTVHRALLSEFTAWLDQSGIQRKTERLIGRYMRSAMRQLELFTDSPARRRLADISAKLRSRQS